MLAYEQNVLRQGKLIHPGRSVSTDHQAAQFLPSLQLGCHSLVPAGGVREPLNARPGRGKGAPGLVSPCPGGGQVEQVLPGGTTGHRIQNRASHPGESLEMEFDEKTGQT